MTRKRDSLLTVIAMSLGFAVVQLDVSVVNVAIRPIGDALGGGVAALQSIVSAYTITFAAFILSAGAARRPRRRAAACSSPTFGCSRWRPQLPAWRPALGPDRRRRAVQGVDAASSFRAR